MISSAPQAIGLHELSPGATLTVSAVGGEPRVRRRLLEMGVTPGTAIKLVQRAPLGDPLEVEVRGYQLVLREEQAREVRLAPSAPGDVPAAAAVPSPVRPPRAPAEATAAAPRAGSRTVALVGNPNGGKTTVFNALTGLRQKVANYPGVTVDRKTGSATLSTGEVVSVHDLPGAYSLTAFSPDEEVTRDVLCGAMEGAAPPDLVVLVLDASRLARSLFLASQVLERGLPAVVALNMVDVAQRHGLAPDAAAIARELGCEVVTLVGHKRQGVGELRAAIERGLARPAVAAARGLPAEEADASVEARYGWIDGVVARTVQRAPVPRRTTSERLDAFLLHRVLGLVFFVAVMAGLFSSIFWLASPLMDLAQWLVKRAGELATGPLPEGPIRELVRDGFFGGVGSVVVFVPQIALLFFLLAALEDTGYLARAAFLADRVLSRFGLQGKSFVPLLSSFACAVPGIMSTRTIEDRSERLATILVAPFMGCSARLPVYSLMIGTFFAARGAWFRGGILLGLYLLGIVAAVVTALLFRRPLGQRGSRALFLELPTYKVPQLSQVLLQTWLNTKKFLVRAGTIIFPVSVLLWVGTHYPRLPEAEVQRLEARAKAEPSGPTAERLVGAATLEHSVLGTLGRGLEPVIRPLGFDWKIGIGLLAAFGAREVFVSTLGIVYGTGEEHSDMEPLSAAMREDKGPDGRPVWSPIAAASVLVFFALALQCSSTIAVVRRETGSWRWPLVQAAYGNGLAYVASLVVFQVGTRGLGL